MKRFLHILLASAIMLSTMGVSISAHYCGKRLIGVSVFGEKKTCCEGKTEMPPGCCHDEEEFHKVDEDFVGFTFSLIVPDFTPEFYLPPTDLFAPESSLDTRLAEYLNLKPPLIKQDLQSRTQIFLI